jgi:uncharacterized protein (TIGR03067 family)
MPIRILLVAFLIAVPALADDKKEDKKNDDLAGAWSAQAADTGKGPGGFFGTWTFKEGKLTSDQGKGMIESTYKIDPKKDPKEIDITSADGKTVQKGIYKIEKDTLTICQLRKAAAADAKRPAEFDATKRDDVVVLTFTRKKG